MKVLQKGRDRDVGKEHTCSQCGSLLLVLPIDVKSYVSYDYGGGSDTVYYVNCPECGHKSHVSYKYKYLGRY